MTRVALVGAGFIAETHFAILAELPDLALAAVVDPDLDRARALAERARGVAAVGSLEELEGLGIDVAHVLTPPDTHEELARALLERGVGVLLEKPAVLDSAAARALARLAAERGLAFGVNHNHAHNPAFERLMARLRAGEIGVVEHVQATWSGPLGQLQGREFSHWMFRTPRNIAFEQGVHPLSQVHALVGRVQEAHTTLLGTRELRPGQTFHDRWLVAGRGERGTAEVYLSFGSPFTRNAITVIGSDGCLEADFARDSLVAETSTRWVDAFDQFVVGWRKRKEHGSEALRALGGYVGATLGVAPREDGWYAGMRASIRAFHEARAAGAPPPDDGEAAAQVLEWVEAATREVAAREAPAVVLRDAGEARPGEVTVFGGTGFIGRPVVRRLLAAGRPVTLVARDPLRLPAEQLEAASAGRLRVVRGALSDGVSIGAAVAGAERVIHLATGGGGTWPEVQRQTVIPTETIAEACLGAGVKRMVYVSSVAALYTGEDAGVPIHDSTHTDRMPESRAPYARGKIACEQALYALYRERGLPVVVVRPGVVVGPECPIQHAGLGYWPRENQCIGWGRGEHPIPLVLVDDVADAIVAAALHEGTTLDGRALNLCPRVPISAREMVEALAAATGRPLQFHGRPLESSFAMEIGKWAVKGVGGRAGNEFPSWRDLRARALHTTFASDLAREVLGWRPVEERAAFLERAAGVHAPRAGARAGS